MRKFIFTENLTNITKNTSKNENTGLNEILTKISDMNEKLLALSDIVGNMSETLSVTPKSEVLRDDLTTASTTTDLVEDNKSTDIDDLNMQVSSLTDKKQELIKSILSKIIATGGKGGEATNVKGKGGEGGKIEIIF